VPGSAAGAWAFIPNSVSPNNSTILYENPKPAQLDTLKRPFGLDAIDIRIIDKYGRIVNMRTNNVHLVIEVYTDKDSQAISSSSRGAAGGCGCCRH
jgi:hypothetical protein